MTEQLRDTISQLQADLLDAARISIQKVTDLVDKVDFEVYMTGPRILSWLILLSYLSYLIDCRALAALSLDYSATA